MVDCVLDPIAQRVLGVLVEKELTVPDSYPLTENSLLSGANQKSNRDPEMSLSSDDICAALDLLREGGWASRVESPGARTRKWRHHFESQLGVSDEERAVLVELLVRGPQAPGALKPRVKRLGFDGTPERITTVLEGLAGRTEPLVERHARRPRERDARWGHLLGPLHEAHTGEVAAEGNPVEVARAPSESNAAHASGSSAGPSSSGAADLGLVVLRLEALEREYGRLLERLARLEGLEPQRDSQPE